METVDDETVAAAIDFIERKTEEGVPWFVWWTRHADALPHACQGRDARAATISPGAVDEYSDGMIEHDMHVGQFLDKLDELGIADNTIVFYSTDNGPHMNTWPDAAMTPFRGEKNTNWEGGWRVPADGSLAGQYRAEGAVTNEIVHHMDWLPTFLAAAGRQRDDQGGPARRRSPSRRWAATTACISTATTSCRC